MLKKLLAGAALALALGIVPASAEVTVRMLHVNQTGDPFWKKVAEDYNKAHPGVKVVVEYMENEAYKAKLPTLLQSNERPNIIYSWAGGVMKAQIAAGYIEDMTAAKADFDKTIYSAPMGAYIVDGKLYGIPLQLSEVLLIYNKDLFAKAGVTSRFMARRLLAGVKTGRLASRPSQAAVTNADASSGPICSCGRAVRMSSVAQRPKTEAQAFVDAGARLKNWRPWAIPERLARHWHLLRRSVTARRRWRFSSTASAASEERHGRQRHRRWNPARRRFDPPGGRKVTDTPGGIQILVTKGSPKEAVDLLKFFALASSTRPRRAGVTFPR
jgi:raffinose/stachyose/melibiose transport system substrate-binding protein